MKLKKNQEISLKLPEFEVDNPLSPHLDEIPLLSHLNKSFACSFIGRAGSGKTSLMTGLLQTKKKFKKVFHKIYLFMPDYSRGSMKKCIFDCLPEDQIYNDLNMETLTDVYNKISENTKEGHLSLIIFDDVQDNFKGECEKLLLKIINNRRHLRTSIMIIAQSYIKMSRDVRKALTNHFLFNLSKEEYDDIHSERIYFDKKKWDTILKQYRKTNNNKGNFLFLDPERVKVFINFDEVLIDEDDED
jgi:ABC-type dipeptide/oligopeptide/nickel transport system ATPase component